jgi:hypothetical protein
VDLCIIIKINKNVAALVVDLAAGRKLGVSRLSACDKPAAGFSVRGTSADSSKAAGENRKNRLFQPS